MKNLTPNVATYKSQLGRSSLRVLVSFHKSHANTHWFWVNNVVHAVLGHCMLTSWGRGGHASDED